MADKYLNYEQLSSEMVEGSDYNIRPIDRNSWITIVAPHGGKIEPGTSELAEAIAGSSLNFYAFEGCRKSNNRDLHITSHKFDEPLGLKIVSSSDTALGIHGRRDGDDPSTVYLGGLDTHLIKRLEAELNKIGIRTRTMGHPFPAKNKCNICNRGRTGRGAQLEIPKSKRDGLRDCSSKFEDFVEAVQIALSE